MSNQQTASPQTDNAAQVTLANALEHHKAGRFDQAEYAYKKILETEPANANALNFLGLIAHQRGQCEAAIELISQAVALVPEQAHFLNNLGAAYAGHNKLPEAVGCFQRAVKIDPNFAPALINLGNAFCDLDRPDDAIDCYQHAVEVDLNDEEGHIQLGEALETFGRLDEALTCYRRALEVNADFTKVCIKLGNLLAGRGMIEEAIPCFHRALEIDPQSAVTHNSLGNALASQRNLDEAITCYLRAIEIDDGYAAAYTNLGVALKERGDLDDAEYAVRQAIQLRPDLEGAHTELGLILMARGEINKAVEAIVEPVHRFRAPCATTDLTGDNAQKHKTFSQINRTKLRHDIEQLSHLLEKNLIPEQYRDLVHEYEHILKGWPNQDYVDLADIAPPVSPLFSSSYNRQIYPAPAPRLPGSVINPKLDTEAITAAFYSHTPEPEFTYFDNFLTDEALAALRRFCMESTMWHDISADGDLGASLSEGFCCPLVLQIAAEIQQAFPKVFGDLQFQTCWSYKYYKNVSGDGTIHVDSAANNLNVWITPDEANLDADGGGLNIWNKKGPVLYMQDYPREKKISMLRRAVSEPGIKSAKVPYKCNRAGIFNGNIIHGTDELKFKDGYENRRINVTFLYGKADQ